MSVEWRVDIERVARYVDQHPDSFAGRWVVEGVEQTVAFTERTEEHEAALRDLLDTPDQLRIVRFKYTWQHLIDLTEEMPSILDSTDRVTGWGPDTKENVVVVGVRPERIDEVRALLRQSRRDDVRVELGEWAIPC
jgi:hypothetical protein